MQVGTDYLLEKRAYTEKLNVPSGLENSKPRDSWFIDPSNLPFSMMIAAVIPAVLVFMYVSFRIVLGIIIFLHAQISILLLNHMQPDLYGNIDLRAHCVQT